MNAQFFKALAERALKTFAQALSAVLAAGGMNLLSVGWKQALSTAAMATLLSVLSSIGSSALGDSSSPSLVDEGKEEVPEAVRAVRERNGI